VTSGTSTLRSTRTDPGPPRAFRPVPGVSFAAIWRLPTGTGARVAAPPVHSCRLEPSCPGRGGQRRGSRLPGPRHLDALFLGEAAPDPVRLAGPLGESQAFRLHQAAGADLLGLRNLLQALSGGRNRENNSGSTTWHAAMTCQFSPAACRRPTHGCLGGPPSRAQLQRLAPPCPSLLAHSRMAALMGLSRSLSWPGGKTARLTCYRWGL